MGVGSGIATLFFNRAFETFFRGTGLSQFVTSGSFFDVNVYPENFLTKEIVDRERADFAVLSMGTMGTGSFFFAQQADGFVWAISKLLRDSEAFERQAGLQPGQALDLFLPSASDIPDEVARAALSRAFGRPVSNEVVANAKIQFVEELKRRVALAHDCNRCVQGVRCIASALTTEDVSCMHTQHA